MKKKVKTVCQIIRFRGKIEAFLVSIDLFDIPIAYMCGGQWECLDNSECFVNWRYANQVSVLYKSFGVF